MADSGVTELNPKPEFIEFRQKIWDELMAKYKADLAAKTPVQISVTLPDGKVMNGESWRTTPLNIAEQIRYSKKIFRKKLVRSLNLTNMFF
jgi:threonyl-tRNA synthetase